MNMECIGEYTLYCFFFNFITVNDWLTQLSKLWSCCKYTKRKKSDLRITSFCLFMQYIYISSMHPPIVEEECR